MAVWSHTQPPSSLSPAAGGFAARRPQDGGSDHPSHGGSGDESGDWIAAKKRGRVAGEASSGGTSCSV